MSTPFDFNTYVATILRHIDGDTTLLEVHCGFDVRVRITARWDRIDAPELSTPEGKDALAVVQRWLPTGTDCAISTFKSKKEKYGRYLVTFYDADGNSLNQQLVDEGHAKPYDGGKR